MQKFLIFVIIFMMTSSAFVLAAEQPKAEEYRKIFSSGSFYVEYDDKNVKQIIAEENGRRMSRTDLKGTYAAMVSILNPLASLFNSGNLKYPNFMYADGKYYKFLEKDYAIMVEKDKIDEENLNPNEGWNSINKSLSLPDELAVFYWNDPYHKVSNYISEPIFSTQMKKEVGGKKYDCDLYLSTVKSASGNKDIQLAYSMLYENGELVIAQSAIFINGKEYEINKINVKKISQDVPKNEFKIYDKAKIYAAGIGDMNDLLENPVFIGTFKDM